MRDLPGNNGSLKLGRRGHDPADPVAHRIMTDAHHSENDSDDETLREQYLAQFDDPERHRTEQARTSVLQLRLDNEEEFGGGRA